MQTERSEVLLFARRVCLILLPVGMLIIITNSVLDPGELFFRKHFNRLVADALVKGQNVKLANIPTEWGELQVAVVDSFFKSYSNAPLITVWGTSRSSEITRGMISPKGYFFNHVIPGGSVLDYVALYGMYINHGHLPRVIIISIDPWSFCARIPFKVKDKLYYIPKPSSPLTIQDGLKAFYVDGMKYLHQTPQLLDFNQPRKRISVMSSLLSLSYFQTAIKSIPTAKPVITKEYYAENEFVIRSDGSYSLVQAIKVNPPSVASGAALYSKVVSDTLGSGTILVKRYTGLFERLLAQLRKDKVKVCLFIPPVHPTVYDNVIAPNGNLLEAYLQRIAQREGILIMGSLNPHNYDLSGDKPFFLDYYHPTTPAMNIIINRHRNEMRSLLDIDEQ